MDLATAQLLMRLEAQGDANHLMLKELTSTMATVREVMSQMSADVDALSEDVPRVLAENQRLLEKLASGDVDLPADVQAQVEAMRAKMAALNSAMDSAVPVPATNPSTGNTEPAPVTEAGPPAPAPEMDPNRPPLTEAGEQVNQANESNA
jgi:hypothetical protein